MLNFRKAFISVIYVWLFLNFSAAIIFSKKWIIIPPSLLNIYAMENDMQEKLNNEKTKNKHKISDNRALRQIENLQTKINQIQNDIKVFLQKDIINISRIKTISLFLDEFDKELEDLKTKVEVFYTTEQSLLLIREIEVKIKRKENDFHKECLFYYNINILGDEYDSISGLFWDFSV
ncbi:hypothetical protein [Candidatus Phytoplasma melaleucae]|uniref:Effector n=1 Tax=Candidatus Phytoplasma melaleucae TaxID=2982630 RepID=A0ABT9DDQ3_9MOLU|nr:hypothetical protein ['Melaleuca sp.' phytoplasma]MDO8168155.1 hypothetical protein ['Melaleuca sp.' phytoplasma]MDV3205464.1 hypothetical protein [Weeping tea tree witches'-broom phytoplasma]